MQSDTITFTSTFSSNLMSWLTSYAKETKKTKRTVLEEALMRYKDEIKRKKMEESFKRAAKDPEMLEMAEEDMAEYWKQLKKYL